MNNTVNIDETIQTINTQNKRIEELVLEIERLNKGLEYAKRIEKDYKTKFDKAIEYVNTHKPSDTISFPLMKKDEENQVKSSFDYEFREIYQKELLDILQGSEKE